MAEKPETVQVHFALYSKGPRDETNLSGWKNVHGILSGINWIMFHGQWEIMLGPSKRGGLNQNKGLWPLVPRKIYDGVLDYQLS